MGASGQEPRLASTARDTSSTSHAAFEHKIVVALVAAACPGRQHYLRLQIVADVGRPLPTCLLCFVPADCWVVNQHFFLVCLPLTMLSHNSGTAHVHS